MGAIEIASLLMVVAFFATPIILVFVLLRNAWRAKSLAGRIGSLGCLAVFLLGMAVVIYPVWNRASNEKRHGAIHQVIRALRHAEAQHWEKYGTYADLNALRAAGSSPVAEGEVERQSGYTFTSVAGREQYTIVAMPVGGTGYLEAYTLTETGDVQGTGGLQTASGTVARVDGTAGTLTVSLNREDGMRPGVLCEVERITSSEVIGMTDEGVEQRKVETEPVCLAICLEARAANSVLQPGEMKTGAAGKKAWRPDKAKAKAVRVGDQVSKVRDEPPAR